MLYQVAHWICPTGEVIVLMDLIMSNRNVELQEGDCVQIYSRRSKFDGCTGRIRRVYLRGAQKIADVEIDNGIHVRMNIEGLISRHTMACDEL